MAYSDLATNNTGKAAATTPFTGWVGVAGTVLSAAGAAADDRERRNLLYQQGLKDNEKRIAQSMLDARLLRQKDIESDRNEFMNQRKTGMAGIEMLAQMREDAMKRKRFGTLRNDLLRAIN